jgi:hypothetical protein
MSPKRSVRSIVGIVAVALTLAGCSLLPGFPSAPTATPSATPAAGECWNATTTQAYDWADWRGPGATACTGSHTLYTYKVGKISQETADTWAAPDDSTKVSDGVQAKAQDTCSMTTLLPHMKWNQQLINTYFFLPTEAQWKAGARWVRCDVGVLSVGTTLDNESFVALPAKISTFVRDVSSDPKKYEFCVNASTPVTRSGPLDNQDATLADCRDHPQWALTIHGNFPDAAGAPFPDDAASNAASSKLCLPTVTDSAMEVWVAYLPTKDQWASGSREIDCWLGVKSAGDSAGTA